MKPEPGRKQEAMTFGPITEPRPDWEPLDEAPFYCLSDGRMCTEKGWADAFCEEVRLIASKHFSDQIWTIQANGKTQIVQATALNVRTVISPGYFSITSNASTDWWSISGSDLSTTATDIPDSARSAADLHRAMIRTLFIYIKNYFGKALYSGAARIMARPRNVLSAFEYIAPDQWHFFNRDDPEAKPSTRLTFGFGREASATGPQGEKLYSIFVGRGLNPESKAMDPQQQCQQWLAVLLREYPERPPQPIASLAKKAINEFPGLTENAFRRSLLLAQHESGNKNWSRPGAPRKIAAVIPTK
jgi:hypothetical protein